MNPTTYTQLGSGKQFSLSDIQSPGFNPDAQLIESGTGTQYKASDLLKGAPTTPLAVASTSPSPIAASGLTTAPSPVTVPPAPTTPTYSTAGILNTINTQNAAEQAAQGSTDVATQRLQELYAKEGTKSAEQTSLEASQGLPDLTSSRNEIRKQIMALNDSAFNAKNVSENRLAPTFAITGEQAAIDRQTAVRTYGLSAADSALTGDIALANDYVTKALAAEFDPITQQIDYYTNVALPAARAQMTDAQKAKADSIQVMLAEQAAQTAQAKTDKAAVYTTMTSAAQYAQYFKPTADYPTLNSALNAMQAAPDGASAAAIAAATGLTAPKTETASIQEYEYAKSQGYTGSYSQYQTEDANRKAIAAGGGQAGTFSTTQANTGAANAGIPAAQFNTLTADDKNYFINGFAGFTAALKKVQDGTNTSADLKAAIDEAPLSDAAKQILYTKAGISASVANANTGGFFSNAWNFIKGVAGF